MSGVRKAILSFARTACGLAGGRNAAGYARHGEVTIINGDVGASGSQDIYAALLYPGMVAVEVDAAAPYRAVGRSADVADLILRFERGRAARKHMAVLLAHLSPQ